MSRACYLISYDIPDDKRRLKIAQLLEGYGERVQYSVFEVWVTEKELEQLCEQLRRWVKASSREAEAAAAAEPVNGSVRIYTLCSACREKRVVLGDGKPTSAPGLRII
ncbi:MAG TPA: CRISPR-associated endonuclease Cas2 [Anaerolineae bacterium]|nr:CRISPR-associated endonuclease Cas2 [Anaerolineae bacterium]HXK44121.1 CRISPR-associated endonuclease Cas2 [Anaerolineae bacterium]